jgi:hypothetical protein
MKSLIPDYNSDGLNTLDIFISNFIVDHIGDEYIKNFTRFVTYNERGLIDNNDVTTYKNFDQICKEVNKADLKDLSKSLSKQVVTLLNNDEWLIIKPLTYESSKKYGANTKWCTTSASSPEYFYRYFRNGILTYCLNKKTGYKIAAYRELKAKSVTFWDQEDSQTDSFSSELPIEIISLLRKEYNECNKSNYSLSDKDFVEKEMSLNGVEYKDRSMRGNVRVGNQFDGPEGEDGIGRFDDELPEIDRGLEVAVPFPQPEADERFYGGPGAQHAIEAEAEITRILHEEIMGGVDVDNFVATFNPQVTDEDYYIPTREAQPPLVENEIMGEVNLRLEQVEVRGEVRPLRVGHRIQIMDEEPIQVVRTRYGDLDDEPMVDEGPRDPDGIGVSGLRMIDFDDLIDDQDVVMSESPPLVGRIREAVEEVRNERMVERVQTIRREAVEEVRNERIR